MAAAKALPRATVFLEKSAHTRLRRWRRHSGGADAPGAGYDVRWEVIFQDFPLLQYCCHAAALRRQTQISPTPPIGALLDQSIACGHQISTVLLCTPIRCQRLGMGWDRILTPALGSLGKSFLQMQLQRLEAKRSSKLALVQLRRDRNLTKFQRSCLHRKLMT